MKKGICVAGSMMVDNLYPLNGWPRQGELVRILDGIERSTGGLACNVGIDLARLDPSLPVMIMGRNGDDETGDLIMAHFAEFPNIDTSRVIRKGVGAFTAVMNNKASGERTFFTHLGANGKFTEEDIDWDKLDCDILHIGYILLLPALDEADPEYGSRMARLLAQAKEHGIRTSVDVVSETGDRFARLVPPALRYTDYCCINELEAQQTTGILLRDEEGRLHPENMPLALQALKDMGVAVWAVIHAPEGGYGLDEAGGYVTLPSLRLPKGYIKGSVGAGDAFCSGILYAAESGRTLEEALKLGVAAAACSLGTPGATEGVPVWTEALEFYQKIRAAE